jgi:hypothetical protein
MGENGNKNSSAVDWNSATRTLNAMDNQRMCNAHYNQRISLQHELGT